MAEAGGGGQTEAAGPASSAEAVVRVRSAFIVVVSVALAAIMVVAGIGGIYDPAPGYEGESSVAGWAWVAAWGAIGLRATTSGVSVRGDRLRIRSLWRTRDIPVAEVERVDTDLYEGFLLGYMQLTWLRVVRFRVGCQWIRAWGLTSRPRTAARLASRLEAACGLQPTPRARDRP